MGYLRHDWGILLIHLSVLRNDLDDLFGGLGMLRLALGDLPDRLALRSRDSAFLHLDLDVLPYDLGYLSSRLEGHCFYFGVLSADLG